MKRDGEIKLLLEERGKGVSQKVAAARVGMSERTVRKYERRGKLPSQLRKPRTHRTRENPFAADWLWVEEQIRQDPSLQAKTLFALLCEAFPGRYQEGQLRTLQPIDGIRCVVLDSIRWHPTVEISANVQHFRAAASSFMTGGSA